MTETEEHKFSGTFVDIIRGQYRKKKSAHRFLSKTKMVATVRLAGVVSLLQAQCETPEQLGFFRIKHTKLVIVMVNIA